MKIKMKIIDLVTLLTKPEEKVMKKYNLSPEKIKKIQEALKKGNWRFTG